ncbi:MAG: metal ABC transporter ATP-binding protein [Anaerorhabdus sp.]
MIECKQLKLGYPGKVVIENCSFSLNEKDYLCILGENGAGKSTLMKTILNLIPPLAGEIKFQESLLRSGIGYLPQQNEIQKDFPATVFEVVLSGGMVHNFFKNDKAKEKAMLAMKKMNIDKLARKSYRQLSGGQQQRVLLARALCAGTKLLMLDEPAANLDPKASQEFYKLIKELNENEAMTIIMISHDLTVAKEYANVILQLGLEQQLFFGAIEEYLQSDIGKSFCLLKGV